MCSSYGLRVNVAEAPNVGVSCGNSRSQSRSRSVYDVMSAFSF
jgi:hypothetical protein